MKLELSESKGYRVGFLLITFALMINSVTNLDSTGIVNFKFNENSCTKIQ